ncbi:MAG: hypothetical protein L3J26_04895 [Candidatus Polarisedimenticolaceae bacterium]|nr:hypothetical protein [Candidatus Polarisedimenticolaceae bacterium]
MNHAQSLLPRLLPTVAALGSAALLVLILFDMFNAYRATQGTDQGGEIILRSRSDAQPPASTVNLSQIPGWHLFGDGSSQPQSSVKREIIEAPTTPLALTLQGTILGKSGAQESWAIISSSDNAQAMYRVGDEIPGGATLFAVEAFRVILERNGRHESLALPRPLMDEGGQQMLTTQERQPATVRGRPAVQKRVPRPASASGNQRSERQALIDEMAELRKRFAR